MQITIERNDLVPGMFNQIKSHEFNAVKLVRPIRKATLDAARVLQRIGFCYFHWIQG